MKFMKLAVRICSLLGTSFCVFCLILFFSGIFPYIVLSGSMEPSIPTGSVIFIQTREIFVQPGDVILYTGSAGNVTHRVVKAQNEVYVTKGDANSTCDPLPVKKEQIKGKVLFHLPGLGYVVLFFRTSKGICLLILFSFLFFILKYLFQIYKPGKDNADNSREKL